MLVWQSVGGHGCISGGRLPSGWGVAGLSRRQAASPDEFLAVAAEGWLPQERGHELVAVDLVDASTHCALALPGELPVGLLGARRILCVGEETHRNSKG